jgi:hypothetical protein
VLVDPDDMLKAALKLKDARHAGRTLMWPHKQLLKGGALRRSAQAKALADAGAIGRAPKATSGRCGKKCSIIRDAIAALTSCAKRRNHLPADVAA